jgi:hypothetical protein
MINNIDNNSDRTIIWQKWADPFGQDFDDMDWTDYDKKDFSDDSIETDTDIVQDKPEIKTQYIQVIRTPMGIIPMNEHTACGKIFNFWTGHTNFNISESVASDIENTEGVETLDIFTRYRFRIAIGKAFRDSLVMQTIQNKLCKK